MAGVTWLGTVVQVPSAFMLHRVWWNAILGAPEEDRDDADRCEVDKLC